jgi:multiple antibiotic resistance protein
MAAVYLKFLALALSALFPLINPVGSALVFLTMVGTVPRDVIRSLAKRIAFSTTLFLLVVDLGGAGILQVFGISLPVVQLAGGLVVAAMGWRLLNESDTVVRREPAASAVDPAALGGKVFYPFTFPITAGPGTLVVTLTLSAHASKRSLGEAAFAHLGIFSAVVLQCVGVYFCYAYADAIARRVSQQTAHGILRVIAFILFCIGVQIAWNGLAALVAGANLLPK